MSDISIILCSYNRAEALAKTLKSLSTVVVPVDTRIELLLIDNSSEDDTLSVMTKFKHEKMSVRVLRAEQIGLSHARNKGVAEASGKVLLFTDDDVRFPENWIIGMTQPIMSGEADAVAGGVYLNPDLIENWLTVSHRSFLASTEKLSKDKPERIVGANMAISKHVFDTIPKFDTELGAGKIGAGEETLLSLQMKQANFKIKTAFEIAVMHCPDPSRISGSWFRKAAQTFGESDAYISYHWKHRRHSSVALYLGLSYYKALLWMKEKIIHGYNITANEVPLWEFKLLRKIHRIQMHFRLKESKFKYDLHRVTKKT